MPRATDIPLIFQHVFLSVPVIAINLSWFQLKNGPELVRDVIDTLAKHNLVAADIEFDVTEAMLAQLTMAQNAVLPQLRELGVKIAIDNFGSEYSSLEYVRAYRVNHLKIAQSFINRSTTDPESAATIRAIVNFARDTGVAIIAQGVESATARLAHVDRRDHAGAGISLQQSRRRRRCNGIVASRANRAGQ